MNVWDNLLYHQFSSRYSIRWRDSNVFTAPLYVFRWLFPAFSSSKIEGEKKSRGIKLMGIVETYAAGYNYRVKTTSGGDGKSLTDAKGRN